METKTRYYWLRVPDTRQEKEEQVKSRGIPIVCVCVKQSEEFGVARGVAVCSDEDQPCKRVGRSIAATRAHHAMKTRDSTLDIEALGKFPLRALDVLNAAGIVYKAEYDPVLTEFERKLLEV